MYGMKSYKSLYSRTCSFLFIFLNYFRAGKEEKINTNTATIAKIPPLLFVTIIDLIVFAV